MTIKNKLRAGFGFLFVVLAFFAGVSSFYLNRISSMASVILEDNYESLIFTREMRKALDNNNRPLPETAVKEFERYLEKEKGNITEKGEGAAVKHLSDSFEALKIKQINREAERAVRYYLTAIDEMNMQAIVHKNGKVKLRVNEAQLHIGILGTILFLLLISFSYNFPAFIADPINSLVDGIIEISRKNYRARLNFDTKNDEFSEVAKAFNQMASRLDQWEHSNTATILSEKSRIETIIRQMQDAIIGINEKGEVIFLNPVAENLFSLQEKKVVGQQVLKLSEKNDLLRNVLTNQKPEIPLKIFSDNKQSYFLMEKHKIIIPSVLVIGKDEEGPFINEEVSVGEVFILRNITRFRELDEAKTNFIATISHELKTPISAIKLSLKLLKDNRIGELNSDQQELVENIAEDSNRLLKITSELLDLSQVETGNIQLSFMETEPNEIVDYAVDAVKFSAEQKKITIVSEIGPNLSKVNADQEKTAWVLVNFLSNAIRYSIENSKIIISAKNTNGSVQFTVRDFGRGIEAQYLNRLFERYFQVPTDGRNKSGSGLGLAISKDFIEAQSGEIFVESEFGSGSTFGFSLPKSK